MKNTVKASKEFIAEIQKMTKEQVYELLQEKVTAINEGVDDDMKHQINAECAELCKQYAELSKLTVFGVCAKAEYPVLEFAKTFYFPTVKLIDELGEEIGEDGKKHTFVTRKIEENEKRLDLFEFLTWADKCNKQVTAKKNWKTPCKETRNSIASEWKKFFNSNADSTKINKKDIQENLQKMYDALLFIPSENNNNRVMATRKMAGMMFGFANIAKDSRNKDGDIEINSEVLPDKQWIKLVMYALHKTVKDKDYAPNELGIKVYFEEEEVVEAETK